MLLLENITGASMDRDEWVKARVGRFTSSENYLLMAPKGLGQAGTNYVYRKVGEKTSERPCRDEILSAAIAHGNTYELDGLEKYRQFKGINEFRCIRVFVKDGERFGSTPDAIHCLSANSDGLSMNVSVIEVKCPYSFDAYIRLWKCTTPADVREEEFKYYVQVIDQMQVCGALTGSLVIYQPFFKEGGLRVIEFNATDKLIYEDMKLLATRKKMAEEMFNKLREEIVNS